MPNSFSLASIQSIARAIGKGVVFYAPYWDGEASLSLTHLGDTEEAITFNPNAQISYLTTEATGPAKLDARYDGEDPVLEFSLALADAALRTVVSPNGTASGGRSRGGPVTEYTLAVFPEALFINAGAPAALAFDGAAWTIGGQALTARQTELLGLSLWLWRGHFSKPPLTFVKGEGDIAREVQSVTFQVMLDDTKPEGEMLYTIGDPADAAIDIDPGA